MWILRPEPIFTHLFLQSRADREQVQSPCAQFEIRHVSTSQIKKNTTLNLISGVRRLVHRRVIQLKGALKFMFVLIPSSYDYLPAEFAQGDMV